MSCVLVFSSGSALAAAPADPAAPSPAVAAPGDDTPEAVAQPPAPASTVAPPADAEPPPPASATIEPETPEQPETPDERPTIREGAKPPRISGPYLGLGFTGGITLTRVNAFSTDAPFSGAGGYLRFGQMVLPWFGLGLQVGGQGGAASDDGARETFGQGGLLVDFNFVPAPKRVDGLSLRGSFGFGGGAVNKEGIDARGGYGGAVFGVGGRYEFFPGAHRYRATKAGGFGIGPELAWLGFTPAARGRPMSNSFSLGLSATFYFGE